VSTYSPRVIRTHLGEPEAIVISLDGGETVIMADHNVPADKLAAVQLLAEYLPTADIPTQRGHNGVGREVA
jgi:hypothetical protein